MHASFCPFFRAFSCKKSVKYPDIRRFFAKFARKTESGICIPDFPCGLPGKKRSRKFLIILINMLSATLFVSNVAGNKVLPISPLYIAIIRDITHHMVAILFDLPSSFGPKGV
jgi:hypothetical protein